MNSIKDVLRGIGFLIQGFGLLRSHPSLLVFVIIPFCINLTVFILGVYFGSSAVAWFVAWAVGLIITPSAGIWYSLLYYPILILLWLGFLVTLGFVIFIVGSVIASPFHSLLAEKTLEKLGGLKAKPFRLSAWVKSCLKMLAVSLLKAVVFGLIGICVFVASFIPGVNLLGSFVASLIVAFDTMDYGFEINEWSFKRRLAFFRAEFSLFAGMGLVLCLTLLIPGLTLLLYPAAVVGASANLAQSLRLQRGN